MRADPPCPETPVGVIGDVHGCAELLEELLGRLDEAGVKHIVTVGDYVDRGERSADVLHMLRARSSETPETLVCLMGNHEKMMLDFLDRPVERGARWLRNGGLQTLASFGIGNASDTAS